jgi:adenine/guanine phosphoribosyltransferase-like PRPP-binding protein
VKGLDGSIVSVAFLIELAGLNGRTKLAGESLHVVLQY